jgi:low temperature requirement protein LtrA
MSLHARTFRKAREQVRLLINDGFSDTFIKKYLFRWAMWWVEISDSWRMQKIVEEFFNHSWNIRVSAAAMTILPMSLTLDNKRLARGQSLVGLQARS